MGLVLKHVEQTKAGSFQYRRRVPKDLLTVVGKTMFKKKLGDSRNEALKAWPIVHAEVERQIAAAERGLSAVARCPAAVPQSDREAYAEALRRRADLIEAGVSDAEMAIVAENLADSYPQDARGPLGVPPAERHTINLLRLGPERYRPPEATLGDALRLYRKEHLRENDPETDSRVVGLANRVIGAAINAMGRDPSLTSLTREDARKVRDEMLDRVKARGRGVGEKVSPETVSRELSIIAAVVNFARVEFGLPGSFQNPFNKLPVARAANGMREKRADKRDPLPPEVLTNVRARILRLANADLSLVWRLLEGTGCRIAEVTGLMVEDVDLSSEFPHFRIEANDLGPEVHIGALTEEGFDRILPHPNPAVLAGAGVFDKLVHAHLLALGDPLFIGAGLRIIFDPVLHLGVSVQGGVEATKGLCKRTEVATFGDLLGAHIGATGDSSGCKFSLLPGWGRGVSPEETFCHQFSFLNRDPFCSAVKRWQGLAGRGEGVGTPKRRCFPRRGGSS